MQLLANAFKQTNDWTCGPAVTRIVLDYYGYEARITELVRKLNTTKAGTSNRDLLRVLRGYGIEFRTKDRATLPQLSRLLAGHLVVVAYWIPRHREAHYSIVTRMDRRRIYFHDTWFGSRHSYTLSYFEKNWWDPEATRWLLAVKK